MLYLVTFTWGDRGILTGEELENMLKFSPSPIVFYEVYEPIPPPEEEPPLEEVPLVYRGSITKKELEYDESRKAIPVY